MNPHRLLTFLVLNWLAHFPPPLAAATFDGSSRAFTDDTTGGLSWKDAGQLSHSRPCSGAAALSRWRGLPALKKEKEVVCLSDQGFWSQLNFLDDGFSHVNEPKLRVPPVEGRNTGVILPLLEEPALDRLAFGLLAEKLAVSGGLDLHRLLSRHFGTAGKSAAERVLLLHDLLDTELSEDGLRILLEQGTFGPLAKIFAAPVFLHVHSPEVDQIIPIVRGWNWISFNALPASHDPGAVLVQHTPQDNDLIKGALGTATFYGGAWCPTSGFTRDGGRMYLLLRQQSGSADLTVRGRPVDTTDSISLVSGWNWLGYTPQTSRLIPEALANLAPANDDLIKSQSTGSATFFEGTWYPDSYELAPGRGYLLKLTNAQDFAYDAAPPPPEGGEAMAFATESESLPDSSPSGAPGWTLPAGKWGFVFRENKDATDLTCTVEWSDTLAPDSWTAEGVGAPIVGSEDASTQQVRVTVPTGSGVTRRFVRLRVSSP